MQIFVVEREKLFKGDIFEGFISHEKIDFESRILKNLKIMRRGNAEVNENHKQPIGYMLIINPKTKKIFTYKRASKDEHYFEKRLHGKWSCGVGGHIEAIDFRDNPIKESMTRELKEEIKIDGEILDIFPIGYINKETGIEFFHFGILYAVAIDGEAKPNDTEIEFGEMCSLSELKKICISPDYEVEEWTKIALEPLKKYFDSISEKETYLERDIENLDGIFKEHISKSNSLGKDLFEHWKKPGWDEYFMSMSVLISMRSVDPSQKNGCVIVDENKKVLSIGYNGFPRGSKDEIIPLTRPEKYLFIEHAEKNAILNKQFDIKNSTLYVTAFPCLPCFRSIIQSGIKKVVYLDKIKSREISEEDEEAIKKLMVGRNDLILEKFEKDPLQCLYKAIEYYKIKKMSKEKDK